MSNKYYLLTYCNTIITINSQCYNAYFVNMKGYALNNNSNHQQPEMLMPNKYREIICKVDI